MTTQLGALGNRWYVTAFLACQMVVEFFFQHLYMSSVSSISHVSMFGVGSGNSNGTKENLGAWALV